MRHVLRDEDQTAVSDSENRVMGDISTKGAVQMASRILNRSVDFKSFAPVIIFGYGLCIFGYVVGIAAAGRPILGLIMLSPFSFLMQFPLVGVFIAFSFWYFVALFLQNASRVVNQWMFVSLLLGHYAGAAIFVSRDLLLGPPACDMTAVWAQSPFLMLLFFLLYILGHGMLWYAFLVRVRQEK